MRKPKIMSLKVSNIIWAWMQRHNLPDNFLTDDVIWNPDRGGYVFGYEEKKYLCTKEGFIKEILPIQTIEDDE